MAPLQRQAVQRLARLIRRPPVHAAQARTGRLAHRLHQLGALLLDELADAHTRLAENRHRAGIHGVQGDRRALLGQRGEHDGGDRLLLHQLAQEGQVVHARHFHVHHQHVGAQGIELLQGEQRIVGDAHHLDVRLAAELLAKHGADHRRVVDDHYLDHADSLCRWGTRAMR